MPSTGTFTNHPTLVEALPPLVRKQRKLIAQIVLVAQQVEDESAVRKEIDLLLVAAGLKKSDVVTCNGYDVRHNERDGQRSLNADTLTAELVAAGVDPLVVAAVIEAATETGKPSAFATVTPSKGAKVTP